MTEAFWKLLGGSWFSSQCSSSLLCEYTVVTVYSQITPPPKKGLLIHFLQSKKKHYLSWGRVLPTTCDIFTLLLLTFTINLTPLTALARPLPPLCNSVLSAAWTSLCSVTSTCFCMQAMLRSAASSWTSCCSGGPSFASPPVNHLRGRRFWKTWWPLMSSWET